MQTLEAKRKKKSQRKFADMEEIDEHSNFRKTKLKPKLIMVLSKVTEAPTMKEARKPRNP